MSSEPSPKTTPLDPGPALYLVATPIGNLEDITLRALRVLKGVNLIACEDTRQTQKLLHHYGITTRTISYHEHNEMTKAAELVVDLEGGARIALVTDAGMPGISDPGFRLITLAIRHHVPVIPIPGASAFLAALVASGCGTVANLKTGEPELYGGVQKDVQLLETPHTPEQGVGIRNLGPLVLFVDLPLSFVGDTLTMPLAIYEWHRGEGHQDKSDAGTSG